MLKKRLIINTKVNKNNRKYTLAALEAMQKQINAGDKNQNIGILGQIDETGVIAIDQVAFTYENAVIENEALYADIVVLKSRAGKELKNLLETDLIAFRPVGNAEMPDPIGIGQAMDLLNISQSVGGDYSLVTIMALTADEDAVVI